MVGGGMVFCDAWGRSHVCMCVLLYMCLSVRACVCMHVYVCMCMCACVCVCVVYVGVYQGRKADLIERIVTGRRVA